LLPIHLFVRTFSSSITELFIDHRGLWKHRGFRKFSRCRCCRQKFSFFPILTCRVARAAAVTVVNWSDLHSSNSHRQLFNAHHTQPRTFF
jgi:hypothetical protein